MTIARLAVGLGVLAWSSCPAATPSATPDGGEVGDPGSLDTAMDSGADAPVDTAPVDTAVDTAPEVVAGPSTLDFPVGKPGPFNVGYRTWEVTYVPAGVGVERTLPVHAWYPTEDTDGPHPQYLGFILDQDAIVDATAAPPVDGVAYPVHVHSHGHQAYAGSSANLMRFYASHGWVVVSPDHVGDLLSNASDSETVAHYLKRPQDVSRALDALEELPAADPLAKADTSRVVVSGHSRGCTTVWAVAGAAFDRAGIAANRPDATSEELDAFEAGLSDARVVAAIPMAGTYSQSWYGATGYLGVSVPVLALTGDQDNPGSAQTQWDFIDGIALTWVELAGGCHQTFALGACGTLDMDEGFAIVNTYALAFGRRHVLDDQSMRSRLDGSVLVSSKATLQTKSR